MGERGLILNAAEVRAVLSGNKTQHRVPVKPQPNVICTRVVDMGEGLGWRGYADGAPHDTPELKSPFGAVGDGLYVRETWVDCYPDTPGTRENSDDRIWFRADVACEHAMLCEPKEDRLKWRAPVTMPKRFSRVRLKVRRVWVERVQEADEHALDKSGMTVSPCLKRADRTHCVHWYDDNGPCCSCGDDGYKTIWNAKHGKQYPWDSNPWAWCCEFEQQEVK